MAKPPHLFRADGRLDGGCCTSGLGQSAWWTRSVSTPAPLMSHGPSGLMAWATHLAALHARAQDGCFSFVATLLSKRSQRDYDGKPARATAGGLPPEWPPATSMSGTMPSTGFSARAGSAL
jgi:hypothetical protein